MSKLKIGPDCFNASARTLGALVAAVFGTQSNRLETDRSSLIRCIASAIKGAMVS
jgi:hypothetical protein